MRTNHKSTALEIFDFCDNYNVEHFSNQALSAARENLNSEVFEFLNKEFVNDYYEEDFKTYKNYLFLACDGCRLSLPNSEELKKEFGCLKNQNGLSSNPAALTSVLYDLENEIILNSLIRKVTSSEKQLIIEQVNELRKIENLKNKNMMIIFDRGYPSLEVIAALKVNKINFIMRCSRSWLKEAEEVLNFKESDKVKEVTIKLKREKNKKSVEEYYSKIGNKMSLRFIGKKLSNGEKGIFVTDLDKEEFPSTEILNLYKRRWEIESHFRMEKQTAELENFACKTKNKIQQEYYSKILMMNYTSLFIHEAIEEQEEKFVNDKFKINKNLAYGIVKENFDDLVTAKNNEAIIEKVKERILLVPKIPIRKNRNFIRHEKIRKRKFEMNRRRAS